MANTVQITQVQDGPSDTVYHVYLESDGASGELTNQVILNPATLISAQTNTVPMLSGPAFNIQQVWYNFSGFNGTFSFDSAVPLKVLPLTPSVDSYLDFRPMGGLPDRTPAGSFPTGKLMFSTNGFSSLGSVGFFVIKVRKMK
jgi:hypothetical protein